MQSSISKYRITKRVGGGSFGDIYLGVGANGEKVSFSDEFFNTVLSYIHKAFLVEMAHHW